MGRYLKINHISVSSKYSSWVIVGALEYVDDYYYKNNSKHLVCMNWSNRLNSTVFTILPQHQILFLRTLKTILSNYKSKLLAYIDNEYFNNDEILRLINPKGPFSAEQIINNYLVHTINNDKQLLKIYWI